MVRIIVPLILEREPRITVRVDKEFKTTSKLTRRVIDVAHAFGIGLDESRRYVVFKDLELEVNPGDVVYVTGESGGGKSVLVRELARQLSRHREFGGIVTDSDVNVSDEELVIEGVGKDTAEAIDILSHVRLSEAFLFLRRYGELSEGQKYRYRLAKALASGKWTLVLDEFCATLDRDTAKVVAHLAQKLCRRTGKTLVVATIHKDLLLRWIPPLDRDLATEHLLDVERRV